MPLDLPNLDDLTWQQLAELGRSSIPGWAPEWTNHNAADPGITLVELFAYLSEILIYRLNRISAANMWAFLRLINGPDWKPPQDLDIAAPDGTRLDKAGLEKARLDQARLDTLKDLGEPRRAVTAGDFERLALAAVRAGVARAKAIFRRDLAGDGLSPDAPGHVSVIVVPNAENSGTEPSEELLERVRKALEPARLLTTRVHVVGPRYLSFAVHATLVIPTTAHAQEVNKEAIKVLTAFFDPLKGGLQSTGWPFGRSLYVSEVYELLAKLPGVRFVRRSINPRTGRSIEELAVAPSEAGRRRLNQDGKLEAIHLDPDELVHLQIQEGDIAVVHEHNGKGVE
ncbi:MAG TPA: baseplate J/gp47 family protein [Terriglobia bacterium]|nr:baseplate J/gp47 family protein [Terriglobia bacterium]